MMNIDLNNDTISALATSPSEGAIAVIRVSGKNAFNICDKIFVGKKKISNAASHTIHYGNIIESDNIVDDVLVSIFKSPNSYTGEDVVEISSHGSFLIIKRILELLNDNGARNAEPGEFTRRAFLNGKLDLVQAEAVADIINSRTEVSLRGARNQLDGLLSAKVKYLRDSLVNSSSLMELELDFSEEDVEFINADVARKKITEIVSEIDLLLSSYSFGKVVRDGVNVSLVGVPNVGKSSLMNYILKESRAIVSEIPGTTRDIIREEISIDGVLFRLTDTAGIRFTEDEIEKQGVFRSREAIKNSDLVLFINDIREGVSEELYNELLNIVSRETIITVMNKLDLKPEYVDEEVVSISAKTGEGISRLFEKMKEIAYGGKAYSEKSAIVTNSRHYSALKKAKESLGMAIDSISSGMTGEFIAVDLRNAENALGEIIGEVTSDDILNNIFSKFCIGK
ncbi:MAG: tRNA modification GTPase MnmE [Melioribacteraceae bacterium]|nr:MAG: tRNA modification GTPase MnmE [Melioribacteraceae bacterium]